MDDTIVSGPDNPQEKSWILKSDRNMTGNSEKSGMLSKKIAEASLHFQESTHRFRKPQNHQV